jgi:hypothetical protein
MDADAFCNAHDWHY